MRRTALAAAAALIASTVIAVGATSAHAVDLEPGTPLPAGPSGSAWRVKVSAGVVYATWGASEATASLYRTPADGSGEWQPVLDPTTSVPITAPARIGDGVVIPQPVQDVGDPCATYRVVTATSAWTVPQPAGGCSAPVVGTGGDLVAVSVPGAAPGQPDYQVYDAQQGPAGGVLREVHGQQPALDGQWVVTVGRFAVVATDTTGEHAPVRAPVPASCDPRVVSAAVGDPTTSSGYAAVSCKDAHGNVSGHGLVVPLDGRVPFRLPGEGAGWALGNGFAYQSRGLDQVNWVSVVDFSQSLTEHHYGPMGARDSGSDAGAPTVAWIEAGQVLTAPLAWLEPPPTKDDDTTPPIVEISNAGDAVRLSDAARTGTLFGWSSNADGLFEVETHSSGTPGWRPLFDTEQTLRQDAAIVEHTDVTVCVRVRAEDRAGNFSPWAKSCTRVDARRPTVGFGRAPLHGVVETLATARLRFGFHGLDDGPVVSYKIERRSGAAGEPLGEWLIHRRAWESVSASHVDDRIGRHREVCFRAQATDEVGRVSRWSNAWCRTTPYDDRDLTAHGTHRVRGADLLGGGATALGDSGALELRGLSGREIWVKAHGRGDACPMVSWGASPFFGGSHPCQLHRLQHGFRWYSWRVGTVRLGPIRITSPLFDPLTVDAVAVLR